MCRKAKRRSQQKLASFSTEAVLMSIHKICFHGEIREISILFG